MASVLTAQRKRDRAIRVAERHGWTLVQWNNSGTTAQLIRPHTADRRAAWFIIEIGLDVRRVFDPKG